ncbi:hypothetical protein GPJ56_004962 [Histomonas meleagridis]|uniref:uncharacterized protein n=1 Tax=Histomonas meleagridis TaxID=135588 RepID=UPI00355A8BC4|nr:hypothetical protein GPJ56_004962 [Histomonas meleagridis]KAH0798512.1 hypothetical protein GO595_008377 [Histomonas meleagridis]
MNWIKENFAQLHSISIFIQGISNEIVSPLTEFSSNYTAKAKGLQTKYEEAQIPYKAASEDYFSSYSTYYETCNNIDEYSYKMNTQKGAAREKSEQMFNDFRNKCTDHEADVLEKREKLGRAKLKYAAELEGIMADFEKLEKNFYDHFRSLFNKFENLLLQLSSTLKESSAQKLESIKDIQSTEFPYPTQSNNEKYDIPDELLSLPEPPIEVFQLLKPENIFALEMNSKYVMATQAYQSSSSDKFVTKKDDILQVLEETDGAYVVRNLRSQIIGKLNVSLTKPLDDRTQILKEIKYASREFSSNNRKVKQNEYVFVLSSSNDVAQCITMNGEEIQIPTEILQNIN